MSLIIAKELYTSRRITKETAVKTAGINLDEFNEIIEEFEYIDLESETPDWVKEKVIFIEKDSFKNPSKMIDWEEIESKF